MNKIIKRYMIICLLCFAKLSIAFDNPTSNNILIFVSFSMPKDSLISWMNEANKINAPLIIRGLINNSFRETTKKVINFLPNNKGGLLLDPTLFVKFAIDKVPAVVIADSTCLKKEKCDNYDVIFGNTTLEHALEEIKSKHTKFADFAASALMKLKGND